ncbi:hypothetical protein D3C86_1523000 [compost metagenome]
MADDRWGLARGRAGEPRIFGGDRGAGHICTAMDEEADQGRSSRQPPARSAGLPGLSARNARSARKNRSPRCGRFGKLAARRRGVRRGHRAGLRLSGTACLGAGTPARRACGARGTGEQAGRRQLLVPAEDRCGVPGGPHAVASAAEAHHLRVRVFVLLAARAPLRQCGERVRGDHDLHRRRRFRGIARRAGAPGPQGQARPVADRGHRPRSLVFVGPGLL